MLNTSIQMHFFFRLALFFSDLAEACSPEVDNLVVPTAVGAALGGLVVLVHTDLLSWLQEML